MRVAFSKFNSKATTPQPKRFKGFYAPVASVRVGVIGEQNQRCITPGFLFVSLKSVLFPFQPVRRGEWPSIIPNSQVIVIPYPPDEPKRYATRFLYTYSSARNHCNITRFSAVIGCGFTAGWMRHDLKLRLEYGKDACMVRFPCVFAASIARVFDAVFPRPDVANIFKRYCLCTLKVLYFSFKFYFHENAGDNVCI